MHLATGVIMHLKLPKVLIDCGWLSGDDFPGQGPVSGVKVVWANGDLASWGSFTCDSCNTTDTSGTARETFTPGPEQVHHGTTIIERGDVTAFTLVNWSMGNKLGFLGDVVRDQGHMIWELRHHKTGFPTGLTADVHGTANGGSPGVSTDLTITAAPSPNFATCKTKGAVDCIYNITHISGTATITVQGNMCTVAIPPVNNLDANSITVNDLGLVDFTADFYTGPDPQPCGGFEIGISINGLSKKYEFGQTDTALDLTAGSGHGNGGTALIHWQY